MDCDLLNYTLPPTSKGCTWDGLTWTVSGVTGGDTEYAAALVSARFQLKDADNASVLSLTSATPGEVTLNVTTADAWSITVEPRTLTVAAGTYTYALETTDADGTIKPRMTGSIRIRPEPIV